MRLRSKPLGFALMAVGMMATMTAAQQIDNPEYLAWAACKTGTTVTMQSATMKPDATGGSATQKSSVEAINVEILVELRPDIAIISVRLTLKLPGGRTSSLDEVAVIPAKIDAGEMGHPSGLSGFKSSKLSLREQGRENLIIKGKRLETATYIFDGENMEDDKKAQSYQVKYWFSPDVPGGFVKIELTEKGSESVTTKSVTDYVKSEAAVPLPSEEMDDRTPRGLLRSMDRQLPEGGLEVARSAYSATTADAKAFADAAAVVDLSQAKLEKAIRKQFGASSSAMLDVDRMLRLAYIADVELSSWGPTVNKEKGSFRMPDEQELPMIRVDGHWRVDADEMVHDSGPANTQSDLQWQKDLAAIVDRLTNEVSEGKYKTEDELKKAAQTGIDKILPAATKPGK